MSEPSVWADIVAELHKLAEDALTLVGEPGPFLLTLSIQPHPSDPGRAGQVDAIAEALLGKPGAPVQMCGGNYHHNAEGDRGLIRLQVFTGIPSPRETELARLRAENEQLRAAARQAHVHPTWPTESELKPWESLAPTADRIAESMEPITEEQGDPFDADSQAGRGSAW